MARPMITVICLVLAVACYVAGAMLPGTLLIAAGLVLEMTFWYRLLVGGRDRDNS